MPTPTADRRRGLRWAFASAVGSALFAVPWKLANERGDPAHSVLLLLLVAAIANSALLLGDGLSTRSPRRRIRRMDVWVAVLLAAFTLFGNLASARSIQAISPALLNVLLRADVLIVAIFAWLLLGERVERRFWIGVAIAMIGLVVLQGPMPGSLQEHGWAGLLGPGVAMALIAAACFSGLAILTRHFIQRIDPVIVNALRLWLAVALWFPFHSTQGLMQISSEQALFAGLAALAGPFLGRLFLMLSARDLEARVTSLANLTAPAMTLVFAYLMLSDWPDSRQLIGGAIMIAGIAVPLLRRPGRS